MLCLTCHRVRPALDRADYTAERARLIVHQGLCTCAAAPAGPPPDTADAAPRPADTPKAANPQK